MRIQSLACTLVLLPILAGPLAAQSNVRPGTDVSLGLLDSLNDLARTGTFPTGRNALAMSTTSCNVGAVNVPWLAAMQSDHPFIAFMIVRETDGRMEQISNKSYVKHGFFALSSSQCTPCQNPSDGTFLGVGCSDTYGTGTNGDNFWLGPQTEIDPWLGTWDPICSHFDAGEPPVNPPGDCDGFRSSINTGALGHRVRVRDADLNVANSTFYFQAQYIVRGEPEANRKNNLGSRAFVPSWTGSSWSFSIPSTGSNPLIGSSVLNRWTGALVASTANGFDDGRILLGVKTTDLGNGFFRYEYAIHNRDNNRGVGSLRIPVCPGATVQNVGFHDPNQNSANDWAFSQTGTDLVFETPDNPITWNNIYNFWFDCDALPSKPHSAYVTQFDSGPGADILAIGTTVPLGPLVGVDLGFSSPGSNGLSPEFRACGDLATAGTGYFTLRGAIPSTTAFLAGGFFNNPTPLFGGTIVPLPMARLIPLPTGPDGEVAFTAPGGGGPATVFLQYIILDPAMANGWSFSNALQANFLP